MEKSIENIWNEGFLNNKALVAPKINDLYNRKSEHIIDKYKRMFRINIVSIVAGSFIFLLLTSLFGMYYLGIPMFIMLNIMALVDKNLLKELKKIDKNKTSYQYLKSFSNWMNYKNQVNIKIARIFYPCLFLSMVFGFWFLHINGKSLGEAAVNHLVSSFPDTYLVSGIPLWGIIGVIIITCLLAILGKQLYKWDINLVYGHVVEKLNELIADMEELQS